MIDSMTYEDEATVGSAIESIETNLWLAEGYFKRAQNGLGRECLKSAWSEFARFRDLLTANDATAANSMFRRLTAAMKAHSVPQEVPAP